MSVHSTVDFTERNRLHLAGFLVSFVRFLGRFLRQGIFVIIVIVARRPEIFHSGYMWLGVVAIVLPALLFAYLHYQRYTYYVDTQNSEFVVEQGVFSKSKTVVKFANIIQVNINQNILQKILSIYSVSLNTAGSDKIEVDLYALDESSALALREFLMKQIKSSPSSSEEYVENLQAEVFQETQLLKIPSRNILLISLFSNYRQGLALFFAFCISMYQNISDLFKSLEWEDDYQVDITQWRAWISVLLFALVFIIFVPFVINIFRYYFKYYNFSILRNKEGNFSMHYGLFNTKGVIFNNKRVQTVSFRQNKILKRLDLGLLSLKQITSDAANTQRNSVIEMPGVGKAGKSTVYDLVFESDIYAGARLLRPRIGLFISRTVKATLLWTILLTVGLIIVDDYVGLLWSAYGLVLLVTVCYNFLYYKNYRFYLGEDFLIKNTGVWNEVETVVPIRSAQIVSVSQTFWQIRGRTANLHVITAAENVSFAFFEETEIKTISNYMLFKAER